MADHSFATCLKSSNERTKPVWDCNTRFSAKSNYKKTNEHQNMKTCSLMTCPNATKQQHVFQVQFVQDTDRPRMSTQISWASSLTSFGDLLPCMTTGPDPSYTAESKVQSSNRHEPSGLFPTNKIPLLT